MPAYNEQDSCQDFPPSLSASEQAALQILEGYGIDFAPAYLGRVRRLIWEKTCLQGAGITPEQYASGVEPPALAKGAQQIVDEVIDLINLEQEQLEYQERAVKEGFINQQYDKLQLSEPDRQASLAIANALRELVDLQRAGAPGTKFNPFPANGLRLTLRPDTLGLSSGRRHSGEPVPSFSASFRLGKRDFILRAWVANDFINLQIKLFGS